MAVANENSNLNEQLRAEYEHALFKLVMHDAAGKEGARLLAQDEDAASAVKYQPSPAALQRFEQQLDLKLQPAAKKRPQWKKANRIAVAVLIVVTLFFTAITTVQAFRLRVMSLWTEIKPQEAIFSLRENDSTTNSDNLVINWTKAYAPTFIPAGYETHNIEISKLLKEITYRQGDMQIKYMEILDSRNLTVNTENASRIETVDINGINGMLVASEGLVTIVWNIEERMFLIQTQTDIDTALQIAQGVKYIE